MSYQILRGDCLAVLRTLPDASFDSIVTDPPYELSDDGKQSPARVFLEFAFPQNAKIEAHRSGGCQLPLLVSEILNLNRARAVPSPTAAVPVIPVALDDYSLLREDDIEDAAESAIRVSADGAIGNVKSKAPQHLGCFSLKFTDSAQMLQILNEVGAGFISGGLGVGTVAGAARFPSLADCLAPIVDSDEDVRGIYHALSNLVRTSAGAAGSAVLGFNLARGSVEEFSTDGAILFAAVLKAGGAQLIRTASAASSLASVLESRRVRVVDHATGGAFSFDLIVHLQSVASMGFMGKAWDGSKIAFNVEMWREALRVLKPGGHLLAFSGSRTYHRMTCAIEDAGFEVRDQIMWVYGSGFPKSLDVSKAIDKAGPPGQAPFAEFAEHYETRRKALGLTHSKICAAGGWFGEVNHGGSSVNWANGYGFPTVEQWALLQPLLGLDEKWKERVERVQYEREVLGIKPGTKLAVAPGQENDRGATQLAITGAGSEAARQWEGWGTALKPAHEPICVARKPLIGTVAANVLAHGTGALNIDGCRVDGVKKSPGNYVDNGAIWGNGAGSNRGEFDVNNGRWPANLIHDGSDEVLAAFPDSNGSGAARTLKRGQRDGEGWGMADAPGELRDAGTGSAARFFYCAKASRKERGTGTSTAAETYVLLPGTPLNIIEEIEILLDPLV